MLRSISRYTLKDLLGDSKREIKPDSRAKSFYKICQEYLNDDEIIKDALENYFEDTGKRVRIIEGSDDTDVNTIKEIVKEHKEITGRSPVVFIDCLQLLAHPKDSLGRFHNTTDKHPVDANVFKLKQISREFKVPIFATSSFNRDHYGEPASIKSYKGNGAIECSSDVLLALEPEYMKATDRGERKARREEYRFLESRKGIKKLRLVVLKNRHGSSGGVDIFNYYPEFNCFVEQGSPDEISPFEGITFKSM